MRSFVCAAMLNLAWLVPAHAIDPVDLAYVDRVHLQQALVSGGWLDGNVDGAIGPKTREAVRKFEEAAGNLPDGDLSEAELARLLLGRENPVGFEILPNTDLYGFDYRSGLKDADLANRELSICQRFCAEDAQCAAFTYNVSAKVCFLKSEGAEPSEFKGAISGRRLDGEAIVAQSNAAPMQPAPAGPAKLDCSALPQDTAVEEVGADLTAQIYDITYGFQAGPGELAHLIEPARKILPEVEARAKRDIVRLIPSYELRAYNTTPCLEVSKSTTATLLNIFLSAGTPDERDRVLNFAVIHSLDHEMFATDINGAAINAFNLMTVRYVRPELFREAAGYVFASCEGEEPSAACTMDTLAHIYDDLDRGMVALDFRREAFRLADEAAPGGPAAIRFARKLAVAEWTKGSIARAEEFLQYGMPAAEDDTSLWDYRDRDRYTDVMLELAGLEGDSEATERLLIKTINDRIVEEATVSPGSSRVMNTAEPSPLVWAYIMGDACTRCSPAVEAQVLRWVRSRAANPGAEAFLMLRTMKEGMISENELQQRAKAYLDHVEEQYVTVFQGVPADELQRIRALRQRPMTDVQLATLVALSLTHPQVPSPVTTWIGDFAKFMVEDDKRRKRIYYDGLLENYFSHLEEFGGDEGYVEALNWTTRLAHQVGYTQAAAVFDEHAIRIFNRKIEMIGASPDVVAAARAEDAEQIIPAMTRLVGSEGLEETDGPGRQYLRSAYDIALEALSANWRNGDQRMVLKLRRLQASLVRGAELAATAATNDPSLADQAFASMQLAMLGDTAITAQSAQRRRVLAEPEAEAALRLRDEASDALQMFNYYRGALGIGDPEFERVELARLTSALDVAERQLDRYLPSDSLVRISPMQIEQAQELLHPQEALLILHAGDDQLIGTMVRRTGEAVFWTTDVDKTDLSARIGAIRAGTEPRADGTLPVDFPFADANALLNELFGPALAVADVSHFVIVADGPLQSLPFGILPTRVPKQQPTTVDEFRNPEIGWLGAEKALIYLPTVSSLRDRLISAASAERPFAGFGNPTLGAQTSFSPAAEDGVLVDGARLNALAPLPETQVEVFAMAQMSGAGMEDVFVSANATENKVKTITLSSYSVLLFATHGLMSGEIDGVTEPGLVLSPPQTPSTADDGFLGLSEIMGLKLGADLVILSACNTAAGDGSEDASGLSGLARGFLSAGARSVAVTHWSIPSAATLSLNVKWFEAKRDNQATDWAESMRQAIVAMVESEGPPQFAHPANWGAFEIFGSSS
jgi:CHAT domain-containing protein